MFKSRHQLQKGSTVLSVLPFSFRAVLLKSRMDEKTDLALDRPDFEEYIKKNFEGGAAMMNRFIRVNNIPMMSGWANRDWQWVGLTLSYPYQGK